MGKLKSIKINPGVAAIALVLVVAMILFSGFGYLNNQPPDVTAARIAFYQKDRNQKGSGGPKPAAPPAKQASAKPAH